MNFTEAEGCNWKFIFRPAQSRADVASCYDPVGNYCARQVIWKELEKNGRRWIHSGMIESRKTVLYIAVLKRLHTASCLSVSPSKNWQSQAKIFCLMSPSASHHECVDSKTESWNSDWTCFTFPPIFCRFIPPPSSLAENYWKTWRPL